MTQEEAKKQALENQIEAAASVIRQLELKLQLETLRAEVLQEKLNKLNKKTTQTKAQ